MTMVLAQPDPFSSPIEESLDSATFGFSLSRSNSSLGHAGSSSSTPSLEDMNDLADGLPRPILIRLLSTRELFPTILGYLDTRSLLSLSSISQRFHREILTPVIPAYSHLNIFLQIRIIVCPMAHFEGLKDFMGKYRSFKPLHLHFTYSEQSSLMSLKPDVTNPQDTTLLHTSTSPLSTSQMYGVNHSISINVSSSNSLYQYHHPLTMEQHHQQQSSISSQLSRQLLHTQHENDQPITSSSLPVNTSNANLMLATPTQHVRSERLQAGRTGSSGSSTDSIISDNCESLNDDRGHRSISELNKLNIENNKSPISDLDSKVEAMTISSNDSANLNHILSSQHLQQAQPQSQQIQEHQQQHIPRQHQSTRSGDFRVSGPSPDSYLTTALSEAIPVHSSSSNPGTPPHSDGSSHQGFDISYWQKFALNELFTRLLPYLKTITIGRSDKPSRHSRARGESSTTNGELSPGVCFFLARCFNVMHDMPDTALESVFWMDVTPADVALLVTMIELRDIMVDGRYWKRGYWTTDSPLNADEDEDEDNEDTNGSDWEGFYFLINQEVQESKPLLPPPHLRRKSPSPSGKHPQRKKSSVKGVTPIPPRNTTPPNSSSSSASVLSSSASFQRQTVNTSISSQISGLTRNGSSPLSATSPSGSPLCANFQGATLYSPTFNNSIYSSFYPGTFLRPAAWQGFGDGISGTSSPRASSPTPHEEPGHPAVAMFESYKKEISDSALVARILDKGKHHIDSWDY